MIILAAVDSTVVFPLAVYCGLVIVTIGAMLGISFVLGERHRERATREPYECGNIPTGTTRLRFPVKYYLIAMFFVVFDVEAVFLYAWAVVIREAGWPGFWEALIFIGVLLLALIYLWRQGALDWAPQGRGAERRVSELFSDSYDSP